MSLTQKSKGISDVKNQMNNGVGGGWILEARKKIKRVKTDDVRIQRF